MCMTISGHASIYSCCKIKEDMELRVEINTHYNLKLVLHKRW